MSGWDIAGWPFLGIVVLGLVIVAWKVVREIRGDLALDRANKAATETPEPENPVMQKSGSAQVAAAETAAPTPASGTGV